MAVDCRATGHVAASISQSQYLKAGSQARPGRELEHSGQDGPGGGRKADQSARGRIRISLRASNLDEVGGAAKPLNWDTTVRAHRRGSGENGQRSRCCLGRGFVWSWLQDRTFRLGTEGSTAGQDRESESARVRNQGVMDADELVAVAGGCRKEREEKRKISRKSSNDLLRNDFVDKRHVRGGHGGATPVESCRRHGDGWMDGMRCCCDRRRAAATAGRFMMAEKDCYF